MNTKHLYDSADGLVLKSLRGAVALNPGINLHEPSKTVYVDSHSSNKQVAVISGGGSGHEPAHAGYTGKGMLAACIAGDIFASPSAKQIVKGIQLASSGSSDKSDAGDKKRLDVLAIINNYTGDRLNFGLAIEKARAILPGVKIESVVVADDVSLLPQIRDRARHYSDPPSTRKDETGSRNNQLAQQKHASNNKLVGPRGLAANILVCKILGALADSGASLDVVKAMGDAVVANLYSVGVGLEHCHVPGHGKTNGGDGKTPALRATECEVGLGLHNEPGVLRREIGAPWELIGDMVGMLLSSGGRGKEVNRDRSDADDDYGRLLEDCREGMVLFINNLGGMSQLEMGAVVDDVLRRFESDAIRPKRVYCSSYMTSLNAPGFSISILSLVGVMNAFRAALGDRVSPEYHEISIEGLLDMPTDAYAWVGARNHWSLEKDSYSDPAPCSTTAENIIDDESPSETRHASFGDMNKTRNAIRGACLKVVEVHEQLTEFDTIVGDGDCGDTFKAGALAILHALENGPLGQRANVDALVYEIAEIIEDKMGGTIGALLAIFLNALAVSLRQDTLKETRSDIPWGIALQYAMRTLSRYTPAEIGDRTIIDALGPFCITMAQTINNAELPGRDNDLNSPQAEKRGETVMSTFTEAVKQARIGAERTRGMTALLGRAAYVGLGSASSHPTDSPAMPPDPGAWGICAILEGLLDGIMREEY